MAEQHPSSDWPRPPGDHEPPPAGSTAASGFPSPPGAASPLEAGTSPPQPPAEAETTSGAPGEPGEPSPDHVGRLHSGLSDLDQTIPVAVRERYLRRLGAALMVIGPIWIAVEYFVSHSTRSPLQQGDATIGALWGLALLILGVALFLRYSGGRLWRYGIARMTYDQEILSERVIAALAASSRRRRRPLVATRAGEAGTGSEVAAGGDASSPDADEADADVDDPVGPGDPAARGSAAADQLLRGGG